MYHRVDRFPGKVRVVEVYKDEMTDALFFGLTGMFAMTLVLQNGPEWMQGGSLPRGLLIGSAFSSVFMLSMAFSSGIGRLARSLGRGKVIEIDLHHRQYRRFQHQWFFWKIGGAWQPLPDAPQGAKVTWKGPRSQTALRLGHGRTFFFVTEPGEVDEDVDKRLAEALNRELASEGVTSPETSAPPEPRPQTFRTRWRAVWEYLSVAYVTALFGAFLYSLMVVTLVLDQM